MCCESCEWFMRYDKQQGSCHRHAPQSVHLALVDKMCWPKVEADDYCGDFVMAKKIKKMGGGNGG